MISVKAMPLPQAPARVRTANAKAALPVWANPRGGGAIHGILPPRGGRCLFE
ncbi:hypothetical protein P4H42_07935 [Paenibacillus macerans]|uniref:hypothetical protein n=1 Tax=Paenibacillus macerans TaxID=44252 RepID=UPI002DBC867F|nr:hypothetical protein [Paenibacillus macerans]MEC0329550.1 hypothetical protein [Paenibacillus macerans]